MSWAEVLAEIGSGRREAGPRRDYADAPPYYLTAYGIAVKHGFTGTEEEWLASLHAQPFVWRQMEASDEWTIVHNLGKRPSVTIVDSADTQVVGNVAYLDDDTVQVTFSAAFSGTAYLN